MGYVLYPAGVAHGRHIPVLLSEVVAALEPRPGQVYLDCTAGWGGHAAAIAERVGPSGTVVLVDLDAGNLKAASERVRGMQEGPRVEMFHGSFAAAPREMVRIGLSADMVLADLGFASSQVDDAERGLSFSRDGPLDMRLNAAAGTTAAELVNSLSEGELAQIIRDYGEERHASAVARAIVAARTQERIERTGQLAEVVRSVVRRTPGGIDPATRTFQALRMAVNDELGNLEGLLAAVGTGLSGQSIWLAPAARVAVITFHSLEDRPVKRAFSQMVAAGRARDVVGGHVTPSPGEVAANPRAGSAKLRAVQLVPGGGAG